jgi:hypothetical protein
VAYLSAEAADSESPKRKLRSTTSPHSTFHRRTTQPAPASPYR